jgi:hypothetical protein
MKEDEMKYKKRTIKNALKILNESGIVTIKYDEKNKDKIYFLFGNQVNQSPQFYLLDKFNAYPEIRQTLMNIGFTEDEVEQYFDVEKIRHIQALLRYCEINKGRIKAPKEYIIKAIINGIDVDDRYYTNEDENGQLSLL